ncbi:MAG: universal stress protein [Actinobacteria bacterium]|nr:universal stress protein [Actinomycetota bacterium]
MLEKVLLATDGSQYSDKAASFAARLLGNTPCKLILLTVFEEPVYPMPHDEITPPLEAIPPYEDIHEAFLDDAEALLNDAQAPLLKAGVEVETKVRFGHPAAEILGELEEGGYEMIIMGSHGHGVFGEVQLGSVSYRISHHAKCPVLIVR